MYNRLEVENIIIKKFDNSEYGYTVLDIFHFLIKDYNFDITKSIVQSILFIFLKKGKLFRVNYVKTGTWVYYSMLKNNDITLFYNNEGQIIVVEKE